MNSPALVVGSVVGLSSVVGSEQQNIQQLPKGDEPLDLSNGRYLNETAIRRHALRCSEKFRNGKFTLVRQEFIDEVKADVESLVRELRGRQLTRLHDPLEPDENTCCVTGALSDKVAFELNRLVCRMIQNKVQRQPSVGKSLSRTR